ncbi:MAG: lipopolysaccharide core heptose(I) kinase RfaP [Gammaproteobacteria bacterium]|nr:lipopolysaccharide core heptose(I) kinase RfaP [Gammaproteobacteria bacterium]
MILYIDGELEAIWQEQDIFQLLKELEGKIYRQVKGRRTLQFNLEGKSYFLKFHYGVGWPEILKNLLQLRFPVIGAANEWQAIQRLEELDIDTMTVVAFGRRGWNPAAQESFIVTRELENTVSLEDYCSTWQRQAPSFKTKRALIEKVAEISRRLHGAGVCHRDYYLCHFHLMPGSEQISATGEPLLFLIDLHRALVKKHLGLRWIVKDIAGLYFSSMDIGLTTRDRLRFARIYRNKSLRETLEQDRDFWNAIVQRGQSLYKKLGNPLRTAQ